MRDRPRIQFLRRRSACGTVERRFRFANGDPEKRMSAKFVPFPCAALERSIPDRFAEQVALYPTRIAIREGGISMTYGELGQTVGHIARALLAHCGPAAEPVALFFQQGASLAAAALGVLAAGKHYVPLDPSHPRAHLLATLRDLRPRFTLTDHRHRGPAGRLVPDCGEVLAIDEIDATTVAEDPLPAVAPDALAYVFYTSGSTGRAKGVMDTHRNVLHNIMRYTNSLRITADDRFTLLQPTSSSGAVSDVFGALLTGATLFPVDLHHEDLAGLGAWINRETLTVYHSAPAIFRHVAQSVEALPSLRVIRLEGDTASVRDIDLFRTRCAADSVLVNGLGLTECGLVRQYFVTKSTSVDAFVPVGYPVEDDGHADRRRGAGGARGRNRRDRRRKPLSRTGLLGATRPHGRAVLGGARTSGRAALPHR
jgi:non-ribosomal peptide synthetase component F